MDVCVEEEEGEGISALSLSFQSTLPHCTQQKDVIHVFRALAYA